MLNPLKAIFMVYCCSTIMRCSLLVRQAEQQLCGSQSSSGYCQNFDLKSWTSLLFTLSRVVQKIWLSICRIHCGNLLNSICNTVPLLLLKCIMRAVFSSKHWLQPLGKYNKCYEQDAENCPCNIMKLIEFVFPLYDLKGQCHISLHAKQEKNVLSYNS